MITKNEFSYLSHTILIRQIHQGNPILHCKKYTAVDIGHFCIGKTLDCIWLLWNILPHHFHQDIPSNHCTLSLLICKSHRHTQMLPLDTDHWLNNISRLIHHHSYNFYHKQSTTKCIGHHCIEMYHCGIQYWKSYIFQMDLSIRKFHLCRMSMDRVIDTRQRNCTLFLTT